MSFSYSLDGNEVQALRISRILCELSTPGLFYELQIEFWIMKVFLRLINDTPEGVEPSVGLSLTLSLFLFFFLLMTSRPAAWSKVWICLPFLRIRRMKMQKGVNQYLFGMVTTAHSVEGNLAWQQLNVEVKQCHSNPPSISLSLSPSHSLLHSFCHTPSRYSAQAFLPTWKHL